MYGAPVVPGLTETGEHSAPLHVQLVELMSRRPGGARQYLADGLALLEQAISEESDERMRDRIAAGVALIRGTRSEDER